MLIVANLKTKLNKGVDEFNYKKLNDSYGVEMITMLKPSGGVTSTPSTVLKLELYVCLVVAVTIRFN